MKMTEGGLFFGIGGFAEGFRRAGFQNLWAVEKEPFCQAVIRTRFPETELFTDVRHCGAHNLKPVDVLTAGFPCQDLSVAGKRAGLEGARSGLFWEVVRILGELRPAWFVLENVPGLFSSCEGRDFAVVLNALDELGYGVAWRVLNSQFFGVAQRRRRMFIVGCFGKPCPQEVLFEPESGGWDSEAGEEARSDIAVPLTSGSGVTSNRPGRRAEDDYNLAVALSASAGHHGHHSSPRGDGSDNIIVQQAISSKWAKGSSGPAGHEHHNLTVVDCLAPVGGGPDDNDAQAGHIIIQDARGQRDKRKNGIGIQKGGPMYTLDGTSQHAVGYALRSDPGGTGQGHNTTYAITENMRNRSQGPANYVSSPADTNGVRDFAELPQGMDSARYRALGNAVTVSVAQWIAERILETTCSAH